VTATSDSRIATDEIAHLYRGHHRDLQRAVAAAVRASRNERPAGAFISPDASEIGAYEYPDPPADTRDIPDRVADRIQHVQRLANLTAIKPHDRRALRKLEREREDVCDSR
jgi:hypothetical protein